MEDQKQLRRQQQVRTDCDRASPGRLQLCPSHAALAHCNTDHNCLTATKPQNFGHQPRSPAPERRISCCVCHHASTRYTACRRRR